MFGSLCGHDHECTVCTVGKGCLAGNNDDYFRFCGMEKVKQMLETMQSIKDTTPGQDKVIKFLEKIVEQGYYERTTLVKTIQKYT